MEEKRKQENELQSRREFFKNAAKSTLPVLGLAVLATLPIQGPSAGCITCKDQCVGCTGCSANCYDTDKVS